VAVSIMSICVVVATQVISLGLKNVSKSKDYSDLTFYAKNEIEQIMLEDDIEEVSDIKVEKENYNLRYDISLVNDSNESDDKDNENSAVKEYFDVYEIELTVSDSENETRSFTMNAIKLASKKVIKE